jgi:hypothetical protein
MVDTAPVKPEISDMILNEPTPILLASIMICFQVLDIVRELN